MAGKAKMTLTSVTIPPEKVRSTTSADAIETAFELHATVKVSKRTLGGLSGEGIDSLELEWIETCDWFEFSNGAWHYKGTKPKNEDLYAVNPLSETFRGWRTMRYFFAYIEEAGNRPPAGLKQAVTKWQTTEDRDKAAKHWIAQNGFEWNIRAVLDKPALSFQPEASSGGGAGASLVTSNSRRRVLYFKVGFKGSEHVTATLIQENMNGVPRINKFFTPAISTKDANNEEKLRRWRQEFV